MTFKRAATREPIDEAGLFDYAVAALARRMRTERELRRLMKPRAHAGERGDSAIDAVIRRLIALNYLSDARYAADYTRLRKEGDSLGRRRVQQDLAAKGIPSGLAESAISSAYADTDEAALARQYILRKRIAQPTGPNARKESARVMGRLLRAGFSPGAIFKVLRDWNVEIEEFDVEAEELDESPEQSS